MTAAHVFLYLEVAQANRNVGGDRESFRGNSSRKFDFAHCSDAVARLGNRDRRAVKVPASYGAKRPPKRRKTIRKKFEPILSRKSVFRQFGEVLEELWPNGRQNQLQRQILLQIDLF